MPRREAEKRTRRARLEREGRDITLRTYEYGAEDDYGDATEQETTNSPYTVRARTRLFGYDIQKQNSAQGEGLLYGLNVELRDDAAPIQDGVLAGAAESRPSSAVEVDGQEFHVVRRMDLDNGVVELICELNAPT